MATDSIACELCPRKFTSAVGHRFHVRQEHPGAYAAMGPVFRRLDAAERAERKLQPADTSIVDALYKHCPCGRSYAAHMRERAALAAELRPAMPVVVVA